VSEAGTAGPPPGPAESRCGFACLVGRPNVGKSTLANALVGAKVAITGPRPQTTRRVVRGIVHRADGQLVLVDTPGLHRPRTLLGQRLDELARRALAEVDVVVLCVPADQPVGPGDRNIAAEIARLHRPTAVAVVTKADAVRPDAVAAQLAAVAGLGSWREVVPVSAHTGDRVGLLADLLTPLLPVGPPLFPDGELTDEPDEIMVAELIREQAILDVREELPHSIAVTVEEIRRRTDRDLLEIDAVLWVERTSQKGIVIGSAGDRLRRIGTEARRHVEALLGVQVFLDLRVKVAKDWQRDPKQLRRLGFG
jgi:GTP-binding protein Era